jgi:hypothetical protein
MHKKRAPDALAALLTHEISQEAANDAVISGSGPAPGWDPFEIWRTRVRDARKQRPMDGDAILG